MRPVVPAQKLQVQWQNIAHRWDLNNPNNNTSSIPANGAQITSVLDLGTSPTNVSQSTSANKPIYVNPAINTSNAISLNGTTQNLTSSGTVTYAANTPVSVSALVYPTTIAAGVARFLSVKNGSAGFGVGRSGANAIFSLYGVADYTTSSAVFAANTWAVLSVTWMPSGSIFFYLNGAQVYTTTTSTSNAATANICIGGETATTLLWAGSVNSIYMDMYNWTVNQTLSISRTQRIRASL